MASVSDLCNDLAIYRDDLFFAYKEFAEEFEYDKQATVPDYKKLATGAAFLMLAQVFLNDIDLVMAAMEEDSGHWNSILETATTEDTAHTALRDIQLDILQKSEGDAFRTELLTTAQEETPNLSGPFFFEAFNSVFRWMERAIDAAPEIIRSYKQDTTPDIAPLPAPIVPRGPMH